MVLASLTFVGLTSQAGSLPMPAAAPTILATLPVDVAIQVDPAAPIEVRFSEPMNQSTVSWFIQPPAPVTPSWPGADRLQLLPIPPLANCSVFYVTVASGRDVNGTDLVPGPAANPWRFLTTCAQPFVVSTSPLDMDRNVRDDADLVVTFSEPMNCDTTLKIDLFPPLPPPGRTGDTCDTSKRTFTSHLVPGTRFQAGTTYRATARGYDLNGSGLVPGLVPNPWNFTINTPPTVTKPLLDRTGCLDANTTVVIAWTMSDNETAAPGLTVRLAYLDANYSVWRTITGPRQGFNSSEAYGWALPHVDWTTRVRVEVDDASGGTAANESDPFRIDTGPPSVGATNPGDRATGVAPTAGITIAFSEPMNTTTVEAAISSSPPWPAPVFRWTTPNQAVTISTGGLRDSTTYVITVTASARDTCGPGRTMASGFTFSFTTARPRPSTPARVSVTAFDDSSATLAWDPIDTFLSGAPIPPGTPVYYEVRRTDNASGLRQTIANSTATRVTDRGLAASATYVYEVIAWVDGVASAPSAPVRIRTSAPFFATPGGRLSLLVSLAAIGAAFVVGARIWRSRRREEADVALAAEVREIVDQVRRVRAEPDPQARREMEDQLQSHFRAVVHGDDGEEDLPDPRLEGLYRALAQVLVQSPEVDVTRGRRAVEARLGSFAETLRQQGAAYRLLSEAEASVDSELFHGLPASARKALLLVYFYALEEYLSRRLRALVPAGATLLLGDRGHINVRRRGWEAQWAGLTLGNLLYMMDHNTHFFVKDVGKWEGEVEPLLREAVEARNRTAHPAREGPPLDRVRALVYGAIPAAESVLKAPKASRAAAR